MVFEIRVTSGRQLPPLLLLCEVVVRYSPSGSIPAGSPAVLTSKKIRDEQDREEDYL